MSKCTYEGCPHEDAAHEHADGIILCDEHQEQYMKARDQALTAGGFHLRNLLVEYERAKHGATPALTLQHSPQGRSE